jgi:hypothetical protein
MAELQVAGLGEGLAEGGPWAADRWVPGLRLAVIVTANRSGPLGQARAPGGRGQRRRVHGVLADPASTPAPRPGDLRPSRARPSGWCWRMPSPVAGRAGQPRDPPPDHRVGGLGPLPTLTNHAPGDPPGGVVGSGAQNGGWSLTSPPRSACRSRAWLRSLAARSVARSTLAVANFRLAPTSSASISATDRFSPSGVSQLR